MEILKISANEEKKSAPPAVLTSLADNSLVLEKPSETKINGRVTPSFVQNNSLTAMEEEATVHPQIVHSQNKNKEALPTTERLSDEKIIAEILKPEEKIKVSKSSDKMLKVKGTNTAISLD